MTAVVGVYLHPKACPVRGGAKQVGLSPVAPLLIGGRRAEGQASHRVMVASRLSEVVPCWHCQGVDVSLLSEPVPGGDVA